MVEAEIDVIGKVKKIITNQQKRVEKLIMKPQKKMQDLNDKVRTFVLDNVRLSRSVKLEIETGKDENNHNNQDYHDNDSKVNEKSRAAQNTK